MPYPAQIDSETLGQLAIEVVEEKGWDAWSLRDVAAAAGVSPNALYRHVDGKRGLDVAIAVSVARELRAAISGVARATDPLGTVKAMAAAYVNFAVERPNAYKAFAEGKPLADDPGIIEWLHLWVDFRVVVARVAPKAVDAAAFALWCYLHGRIELATSAARLAPVDAGVEDTIDALMRGYANEAVDSPLPTELQALVEALEAERL